MTAFQAEGCGIALTGDEYKVSVTGFTFSIIRYDKHYGNQPPPVAFPPFGALRHQRGECISNARRAVVWFSHGRKPDCEGFIQTGALYNLEAPYNNPRAKGASNLSPLRTFGPAGRQPSRP